MPPSGDYDQLDALERMIWDTLDSYDENLNEFGYPVALAAEELAQKLRPYVHGFGMNCSICGGQLRSRGLSCSACGVVHHEMQGRGEEGP